MNEDEEEEERPGDWDRSACCSPGEGAGDKLFDCGCNCGWCSSFILSWGGSILNTLRWFQFRRSQDDDGGGGVVDKVEEVNIHARERLLIMVQIHGVWGATL